MSKQYTPGPWEVQDPMGADVGFWIVQSGLESFEWSCIAIVTGDDEDTRSDDSRFITEEEQLANAHLLAAAPDLLQMLKVAQLWLDVDGRFDMQGINSAIAKAEGRQ